MKKSWRKSITWSVIAFSVTTLVTFFFTGEVNVAFSVGLIERAIKIVIYPIHEEIWEKYF